MDFAKVIIGLLGLSVVIIIHELGHLIAAIRSGIGVKAFSLGWGKVLYSRKWRGIEFRLSLFPLGGYCQLQGEQSMIQAWEAKARHLSSAPGDMYGAQWWKRVILALSGPLFNLLFAGVLFFSIHFVGFTIRYQSPRIVLASDYEERQNYPANQGGLQTGDRITAINEKKIHRYDQLQEEIMIHPLETLTLTLYRGDKELQVEVTPELNKQKGTGFLGIYPWIDTTLEEVLPESPLQGRLLPGDRILTVNGKEVNHALALTKLVQEEGLFSLELKRQGQKVVLDFPEFPKQDSLGIYFQSQSLQTPRWKPFYAFKKGFIEVWDGLQLYWKGLQTLFKGVDLQNVVSGPLRITYMTGEIAVAAFSTSIGEGFQIFFRFLAILNIALFVMNLLPIPALDGGQILLACFEGLFRRQPSPRALYIYQMIGTVLVLGLVVLAFTNDILFFTRS